MRKYKKILGVFGLLACMMAISSCGKQVENETSTKASDITFVLDWTPNTNHTGLYVAMDKGYFKEEGLNVTIIQPPEDGAEALVASGKAQFGVSFQDTLAPAFARENPLPITAVGTILQHNTSGILSRKGEGMERPKGMEGHRYATWDLPVEKSMIKNVVESDGGKMENVELIPSTVTDEYSALKTKQVDAIWVYYGWAGIGTKVKGMETDYFAFKDINPIFDYYTPVIIGNNDYLNEHTEETKAFLRAVTKGYEDAIANPEEAGEVLLKYAKELDKSLVLESQKWLSSQYKEDGIPWGYMDGERWNRFYQWLYENQLIEKEIPDNTGFSNEYLPSSTK